MATKNIYTQWLPLEGLTGRLIVEKLEDTDEGLAIYLKLSKDKQNKRVKIIFDSYVAYRNMDESYRSKTFSEKGGFENTLNIVGSSSWLEWLHDESQGFYEDAEIMHYSIITDADCLDILSAFPPEVEWLQ